MTPKKRIHSLCCILLLLSVHLSACLAWGQGNLLQPVLKVAEQTYLAPLQMNLADVARNWPSQVAILIGLTLRGQVQRAGQELAANQRFHQLQSEAQRYLQELAERSGYVERYTGQRIDGSSLWLLCANAIRGDYDQYAIREYGRGPLYEIDVLHAPPPGDDSGSVVDLSPPVGTVFSERQEQQVNLLGQRPSMPPKPGPGGQPQHPEDYFANQVVTVYNAYVDEWNRSVKAFESGNLNGSRTHFDRAQELCNKAKSLSASISACQMDFVVPDPKIPRPADEVGPLQRQYAGTNIIVKRMYLRHWQK